MTRRARPILAVAMVAALAGCAAKLDHFGRAPTFSGVGESRDPIDPSLPPGPVPSAQFGLAGAPDLRGDGVARFPGVAAGRAHAGGAPHLANDRALWGGSFGAPPPHAAAFQAGSRSPSLWSRAPGSLFHDRRARYRGDILTVLIDIDDNANINNSTDRSRTGSDSVAAATVYGFQSLAADILPSPIDPRQGVEASGSSESSGSGSVTRDEDISLRIAARVVQVLPNGHLVVTGNQEVRVNFELRDLQVAGIIRPEDITRQNTISYDRMANARISYGGRGQITDFQQPRVGQQFIDLISPF
ncbi:MAG: flagellar basal body L-ring protein FlgH [Pseudomonadota bacterium]